jgi:hypothetical protein
MAPTCLIMALFILTLDCYGPILNSSCLVVLGFLILHGQLMKKISLFYIRQFSFLPRLGESLINPF